MRNFLGDKKTIIYAVLHMLVDGLCAYSLTRQISDINSTIPLFLIYNFVAFVMQMPAGAFLDGYMQKTHNSILPLLYASSGCAVTIIGSGLLLCFLRFNGIELVGVLLLGCGNALFHVGGGVGSILEDHANEKKGQNLGLFVAPGALGLFLGASHGRLFPLVVIVFTFVIMSILLLILYKIYSSDLDRVYESDDGNSDMSPVNKSVLLISFCIVVVVIRSYIGLAIYMPWKNGNTLPMLAVLCVVLGKYAGGVLAARFDIRKVVFLSLIMAAMGYVFSENAIMGLIALFAFNTTMPITLYLLVNKYRSMPGLFFGLLTVALFLGYIPIYFSIKIPINDNIVGMAGCFLSLALLLLSCNMVGISGNKNENCD